MQVAAVVSRPTVAKAVLGDDGHRAVPDGRDEARGRGPLKPLSSPLARGNETGWSAR
jgi:hypothetical protein